ncbi:lysophospholipid acyltransferase family protein [Clostridium ganghwense]|uniref:1-acyl-sn-glycerol-3-phosphate acyltransferase n=1 Tax=Clostridium ganghwense TaxID=312089 RepID=A0ABT4CJT2_9CLOT|nr:lysophospholipid acyltransferase family protein [Clostridium ganghwense]MCY6369306.1 lysophospholipid acyltransferase family protein [Clostridium ganghwense]
MIKLFWYTYFAIYLLINSITGGIKLFFLRKKSTELADKYAYKKVKGISDHVLKVSKTKTEVMGVENLPDGPCVFVSNHQAIFDGFLLTSNLNRLTGYIAKKEIKKIPLVRSWLSAIHTVYIDRKNIREGIKAINEGVENLKKGYSMIIFPEGTRSLKSEMVEFKRGSMKLALKAKVPIVPITIDGTYKVLEVGNKVTGHTVKMVIHKPIYLETLSESERKNLAQITHDIIENSLKKL